jgi:hypothetical protein
LNKELDLKLTKGPCYLVFGKDDSQDLELKEKYLDILQSQNILPEELML